MTKKQAEIVMMVKRIEVAKTLLAKAQARLVKAWRCKDTKLKDEHILKALEYLAGEAADE